MEYEQRGPIESWASQFEITASTDCPSLEQLIEQSINYRFPGEEISKKLNSMELVEVHAILQATFRHSYTNYDQACDLLSEICVIEKDQRRFRQSPLIEEVQSVREILRAKCRGLFFEKYPPRMITKLYKEKIRWQTSNSSKSAS